MGLTAIASHRYTPHMRVIKGIQGGQKHSNNAKKRPQAQFFAPRKSQKWPKDYYPFGLEITPRSSANSDTDNSFGFNGKMRDDKFGTITNYDYGFRIYNPAIGRFSSVDVLRSEYPHYTPYQFAGNKPIWAKDRDGLEEEYATMWIWRNQFGDGGDVYMLKSQQADEIYYHVQQHFGGATVTKIENGRWGSPKQMYGFSTLKGRPTQLVGPPTPFTDDVSKGAAGLLAVGFIPATAPLFAGSAGTSGLSMATLRTGAANYLRSYYATHGLNDAKEAVWDAHKDITIRGNLEVDKALYNFLPIPNRTLKNAAKNVLDAPLDFTLTKKEGGGMNLKFETAQVTGYDLGRAAYQGVIDESLSRLEKMAGNSKVKNALRDSYGKAVDYLLDKSIESAENNE